MSDIDKCVLCNSNENDELRLGEMINSNNVNAHYFCLV